MKLFYCLVKLLTFTSILFHVNCAEKPQQDLNLSIDHLREKHFDMYFVPQPNHLTTLNISDHQINHFTRSLEIAKGLEAEQLAEKRMEYLLLKIRTIYHLPPSFENGYLFTPLQAELGLQNYGWDTTGLNTNRLWIFCVRYLELPCTKLQEIDVTLNTLIAETELLKTKFENRLEEDMFKLAGFRVNISNISIVKENDENKKSDIIDKLMNNNIATSDNRKMNGTLERILHSIGFDTDSIRPLLKKFENQDSLNTLLLAVKRGYARARNPEEEMSVEVRAAKLIKNNNSSDLTPLILELQQYILARSFNIEILKLILQNFEKATQKTIGFEHDFMESII